MSQPPAKPNQAQSNQDVPDENSKRSVEILTSIPDDLELVRTKIPCSMNMANGRKKWYWQIKYKVRTKPDKINKRLHNMIEDMVDDEDKLAKLYAYAQKL